jgi:hypothetical protein
MKHLVARQFCRIARANKRPWNSIVWSERRSMAVSQELRDAWAIAVDDRERVRVASWRREFPGKPHSNAPPEGKEKRRRLLDIEAIHESR